MTERERESELYRLQADLCQVLADPTRLQILALLEGGTRAVKDLVAATAQRQARISQHLAIMRGRGIVQAERVGNEMHYSLTDRRILDACHVTRALLLRHLERQGALAGEPLAPRLERDLAPVGDGAHGSAGWPADQREPPAGPTTFHGAAVEGGRHG